MTRSRVIALVLLAIGVLAFDVWFFMGRSEAGQGTSSLPQQAGASPSADGSWPVLDSLQDVSPLFSGVQDEVPWHGELPERHRARNPPLEGSLASGLMNTGMSPTRVTSSAEREGTSTESQHRFQETSDDGGTGRCDATLSIVMWYARSPSAVVDGDVVRLGDPVGTCVVEAIHEDRVVLAPAGNPDKRFTLELRSRSSSGS